MERILSARTIQEKLSEGWGWTQLAEYAEVSIEELRDFVGDKRIFNRDSRREYLARLDRNEKKYLRYCSTRATQAGDGEDEPAHTLSDVTEPEKGEASAKDQVAEVQAQIDDITAKIIDLEKIHKGYVADKRALKSKLEPMLAEFQEMKKRVSTMQSEVEKTKTQLTFIGEKLNAINQEKLSQEELLEKLESQLAEMTVTEIYVDKEGHIMDKDDQEFAVADTWGAKFMELRDSDAAVDNTIREIRVVARVMTVIEAIPHDYVILVESEGIASLLAAQGIVCC